MQTRNNHQLHYPALGVVSATCLVNYLLLLIPYGLCSFTYTDDGVYVTSDTMGFEKTPLIDVIATTWAYTSGISEALAGALQVPTTWVQDIDSYLYETLNPAEGLKNSIVSSVRKAFSSPTELTKTFVRGLGWTGFTIASAAGTYSSLEQLSGFKKWLISLIGENAAFVVFLHLWLSGMLGYILSTGPKCYKGIEASLKGCAIKERYNKHGQLAVEGQIAIEAILGAIVVRSATTSFFFARLFTQLGYSPRIGYPIGLAAGAIYGRFVHYDATVVNYVNPKIQVTTEEKQQAYDEHYAEMSACQRGYQEVKRGFPIGYMQLILGIYLTTQLGADPIVAGIIGLIGYAIFYKANLFKDVNQRAAVRQTNALVIEEVEQKKSSTCVQITSNVISIGQQVPRIFTLVAFLIQNELISSYARKDILLLLGLYAGIVVGANRHWTFIEGMEKTLTDLKVSAQGMFAKKPMLIRIPTETDRLMIEHKSYGALSTSNT